MRAVVQRVSRASVQVQGEVIGSIERGLAVLVAVSREDEAADVAFMKKKLLNLRIFDDAQGKMNLSLRDVGGSILLVSQFTVLGDCRKGNRPSYSKAAAPEAARTLYRQLRQELRDEGIDVQAGRFQASMRVELVNEGPVTLIVDSKVPRRG